jgi:class 3 adenylate cyclase
MKRTILIVDDDAAARDVLRQILQPEGHDLIQAESGEQALALATALDVDVFLIGIEMVRMSGIVLCRELRAIEKYYTTPIIFVTGNSADAVLHQALTTSGGDDFIQKPYTAIRVRARIKIHIERMEYFQKLDRVRGILKQYLSKRTLDAIESSVPGAFPEPEERDLAICFTDIRGFTAFSEETEPARLFSLVSELLADQVNVIHDYGGYVDKFGGDGVMAVFDGPGMVVQSCLCALSMLETVETKDSARNEEIRRFGIGIHTGRAVVGNIGSPEHLDYSAIGSTVNLAARLCGQAEATSIIVSKAVRDAVGDDPRLSFQSERQVDIRGFKEPVTVYTLNRGGNNILGNAAPTRDEYLPLGVGIQDE